MFGRNMECGRSTTRSCRLRLAHQNDESLPVAGRAPATASCRLNSSSSAVVALAMALLVVSLNAAVVNGTSDFYYDHWQCNNYLSGETVVVKSAPGRLLELHIRDNIAVSLTWKYFAYTAYNGS